ncbi:unnamed protein product [Blepharisma stoltei]|uniref:Translin-associated factor X-interacting protein 1 N-terminal domain-containing protein n=1 Tax=Blepharisma stoltei TaxID=1481888 RepID=A0AAU9K4R8_9CILI|nr:unnamed protein product [Blepharisma stoltei]
MKRDKKSPTKSPLPKIHHHSSTFSNIKEFLPLPSPSPTFLTRTTKSDLQNTLMFLNGGESQNRTPTLSDFPEAHPYKKFVHKNTTFECLSERNSMKIFNSSVLKTKLDLALVLRTLFGDCKENVSKRTLNRTKLIIKALEILANEDGKYKEELKNIVEEIKTAIFINKGEIGTEVLEHIYEKYPDTLTDLDGLIPFYYLYPLKLKPKDTDEYYSIDTVKKIIENYNSQIRKLNEERTAMSEKILAKEKENQVLLEENNKFKQDIEKKSKENFILGNKVSILERETMSLRFNADEDNKIIIDHQKRLKASEEMVAKISSDYSLLNRDFMELKKKSDNMTQGYSTILYKLKQSYDVQEDLEKQISDLLKTNAILADRAAAGYEGLTPRPNLDPVFHLLDVEVPKGSTADKVKVILKEVKTKDTKKTLYKRGSTLRTGNNKPLSRKNSNTDLEELKKVEQIPSIQIDIPKFEN